jgi:hypothetical protein
LRVEVLDVEGSASRFRRYRDLVAVNMIVLKEFLGAEGEVTCSLVSASRSFSFSDIFEVCNYGLDQNCDKNRNALYLY